MTMRVLLALLIGLAAQPAVALNNWGTTIRINNNGAEVEWCGGGSDVGWGNRICFDFDSTLSPASTTFTVKVPEALACLKPDAETKGVPATASPATARIEYAPYGDTANTNVAGVEVGGITLTGLNGVPGAQLACVTLGPGTYVVFFPTLPDGTDVAIFSVQGVTK